jgi:5-methylthioadenosine/S-adenosylhomocysteine deaminase
MTALNQAGQEIPSPEISPDLIIKGGMIVTMVGGQDPIPEGEVFVTNGRITSIHALDVKNNAGDIHAETINAKDAIIMPGLINGHTHAAMTLFRGLADDLPLKQWLFEKIFPAEAKFLNPDTVYWGSLLGCLEMIASGTTCFIDGYFFQDETVRAAHDSGLRALIAQGVIDFPAPGVEDPMPGIFCHSPLTCSEQTLKDAWEISQQFDLPLQIHLSETSDEVNEILKKAGKRPVHYLDELGLINDGLIAAHAVHLDDSEIECLKKNRVKVVHVPESNMKLCSGVARYGKAGDAHWAGDRWMLIQQ